MKILLVDDHKLFREGMVYLLQASLTDHGRLDICQANDCESAVSIAAATPDLDLVLLDLNLPDCRGTSALQIFGKRFPTLPVIVLSASTQQGDIRRSLDAGAAGFIPKESSSAVVAGAIHLVQSGGVYLPPALLAEETDSSGLSALQLTSRQKDVLQRVAEGKSNKQIGRELSLAETTIKMRMTHIMRIRILQVTNRTQVVTKAEQLGLVQHY